jgi:hypothetical protein
MVNPRPEETAFGKNAPVVETLTVTVNSREATLRMSFGDQDLLTN